jgi:hypothetical protein
MQGMRHRHHISRRTKKAAWAVRVLAILVCLVAIADFTYKAYESSDCFVENSDPFGSDVAPMAARDTEECRVLIASRDVHLRIDALAVLLATALFLGTVVALSHANRRTKRLLFGIEAAVLVVMLAYSVLWFYSWH